MIRAEAPPLRALALTRSHGHPSHGAVWEQGGRQRGRPRGRQAQDVKRRFLPGRQQLSTSQRGPCQRHEWNVHPAHPDTRGARPAPPTPNVCLCVGMCGPECRDRDSALQMRGFELVRLPPPQAACAATSGRMDASVVAVSIPRKRDVSMHCSGRFRSVSRSPSSPQDAAQDSSGSLFNKPSKRSFHHSS